MSERIEVELVWHEDGEPSDECEAAMEDALKSGTLVGEAALVWLADCFANETHGNYHGSTLYHRANLGAHYEVTVKRKEPS